MSTTIELRPCVRYFAEWMEYQLRKNDYKPGWACDLPEDLLDRAREELDETCDALSNMSNGIGNPLHVIAEAADAANFLMMVADLVMQDYPLLQAPQEV